jgi:NAD(P)-dependent dehydrogenase (short-subunit alcohol dehydrogenase family)
MHISSKTAVNALTVTFAKELRDTPIKVNAADPGYSLGHQASVSHTVGIALRGRPTTTTVRRPRGRG